MKVRVTAERTVGGAKKLTREIEVQIGKQAEMKNEAMLIFLNEYINRDCFIGNYTDINMAKKVAGGLKVSAEVLR
jgi:hypothetical protein